MRLLVIGLVAVLVARCSIYDHMVNPLSVPANANGKPTVWQCAIVNMASPPTYACSDGKTYTASQLREFRLGTETPNANNK